MAKITTIKKAAKKKKMSKQDEKQIKDHEEREKPKKAMMKMLDVMACSNNLYMTLNQSKKQMLMLVDVLTEKKLITYTQCAIDA